MNERKENQSLEARIVIPNQFSDFLETRFGREAHKWLRDVPYIVGNTLKEWNLTLDSNKPLHGAMGLVFFVRQAAEPLVLKVSWRDEHTESENRALTLWNGHGAVRLIDYDKTSHVSLMERLSATTLDDVDIVTAGIVAGKLIRELGIEVEDGLPRLDKRAEAIRADLEKRQNEAPPDIDLPRVSQLIADRLEAIDSYLCHGDLAYSNVLQAQSGEWKAIDPKPIIGDLEFAVPELMWTRIDELSDEEVIGHLNHIVQAGELDRQKAIDWTLIRAADYYFWGQKHGLTIDPENCLRLWKTLKKA